LIIKRYFLTRFTFINVLRHKIKKTYKNELPTNIFKL
jgi:hypothetical protein